MNSRLLSLIVSVLLVITLVWFAFYYNQSSTTIASDNSTITSLSSEKTVLTAQLAAANSQTATLQSQLNSTNISIAALKLQIADAQGQISTLQTQLQQAKAQIQQDNTQITAYQSQAVDLQVKLGTANAQITSLQSQLDAKTADYNTSQSNLTTSQSQVASLTAITNLQSSTAVATYPVSANNTVWSFTAQYAGYIAISGNSNSASGYITVTDSFIGYPFNNTQYAFSNVATSLYIPVLPGIVTVSFGVPAGSATASITMSYVY